MAKFFGFEINRKSLSAALASVLGALTFNTAAAQDPAPAADGPAPEVIAKGNIIKQIGKLVGPAVLVYSDRSVKFEGGGKVPAGDYAFIGRQVDKEALFNSGLGTDTISKARNQLLGPSTVEVGTGGGIVDIKNDPDMARFADLARPPASDKPVATIVRHHGPKAGKHVVVSAKAPAETPVNKEVLGAEGNRVNSVPPVAQNAAPASMEISWNGITYGHVTGSTPKSMGASTTREPSAPAPVAQDAGSDWRQNIKDWFARHGRLVTGAFGFLGFVAALTSGRKQAAAGTQERSTSRPVKSAEGKKLATSQLPGVDVDGDNVDGDNPSLPKYKTVAAALGQNPEVSEEVQDSVLLAGDSGQPAIEGQHEGITPSPTTTAPVEAKDTGYKGEGTWPQSIPNLVESVPLHIALDEVYIGNLGSKLSAPVVNQDRGRQTDITRGGEGTIHIALSNNRLRLEIAAKKDGTYAVRASGAGLGRGKAPVEATLGEDGKLVIDQETLAARMSAKQTKGNGIDAEFAKAAFETFGAKAETVITRALKRAVAVIQAAPEPAAVVRRSHRLPAANAATRTLHV